MPRMFAMPSKKRSREKIARRVSQSIPCILVFLVVLLVTVTRFSITVSGKFGLVFQKSEKFVYQPVFNLSALNAACNLNIPEEVFMTCRNKVHPTLDRINHRTQLAISPRIHVLGERHSATNLAAHLAVGNFELLFNKKGLDKNVSEIDFGINKHKHQIQEDGAYESGLTIISIKNPYDYTRSMLKECFSCGPREKDKRNPAAFVGTEWHKGDHIGKYCFENLMAMRKRKYCNYLEKAAELTDCILMVHSEDNMLPIHQERYVWGMAAMTGWPLRDGSIHIKSNYSGYSYTVGGKLHLPRLVDSLMYFKKQFSKHEEDVIQAVNANMFDDFEIAFGYHRIEARKNPSMNDSAPEKQALSERLRQPETDTKHPDDDQSEVPLARVLDLFRDHISNTQIEELLMMAGETHRKKRKEEEERKRKHEEEKNQQVLQVLKNITEKGGTRTDLPKTY